MKHFYTIALFFLVLPALQAQDTLYYHFYNNVQMLEIRPEGMKRDSRSGLTTANVSLPPSIYIFRDSKNRILAQYNLRGKEIIVSSLLSPTACSGRLRRHRERTRQFTKESHRYAFDGTTGYYPVCLEGINENFDMQGIIDSLGNMVLPQEYSSIRQRDSVIIAIRGGSVELMDLCFNKIPIPACRNIDLVQERKPFLKIWNDKQACGLINTRGKQLLPMEYEDAIPMTYHPEFINVKRDNKWGLVRWNNTVAIPCRYDHPFLFLYDGHAALRRQGKFAIVDTNGVEKHEAIYDEIKMMGKHAIGKRDGLYVWLSFTGKELCVTENEILQELKPGWFLVREAGKEKTGLYGIVDAEGNKIWPLKYQSIAMYAPNRFAVALSGKDNEGVFNPGSRWVLTNERGTHISRVYEHLQLLKNGFVVIEKDHRRGIADVNGNELVSPEYIWINDWGEGKIYAGNYKGHHIISPDQIKKPSRGYDEQPYLKNGRARVSAEKKHWGYLDSLGREIIPLIYDDCTPFIKGIAAVKKNNSWILIDLQGKQVMPQKFDHAFVVNHDNGNLMVTKGNEKYLVTGLNKALIPLLYDEVKNYYEKTSYVKRGAKTGVIDENGHELIPPVYDMVNVSGGLIRVRSGDFYGTYNRKGELKVPVEYEAFSLLSEYNVSYFWVKKNGKWGLVNDRNELIYSFLFDDPCPRFDRRSYLKITDQPTADAMIVSREYIEHWYINIEGELVGKRKEINTQKGFRVIYAGNKKNTCTIVNWEGDTIVKKAYNRINLMEENYFEAVRANKKGLLDTLGQEVVPCVYEDLRRIRKTPLVAVKRGVQWGLYHVTKGKLLDVNHNGFSEIPGGGFILYFTGGNYNEQKGYFENAKAGLLSTEGQEVVAPEYDYIWLMDEKRGLLVVKQGSEMCVMDTTGKIRSGFVPSSTAMQRWRMFTAG